MAQLDRAAPSFALSTGQTAQEVAASLEHLQKLGLMQVRRSRRGQQQFRVRTDEVARSARGPRPPSRSTPVRPRRKWRPACLIPR
jgi:hypothetical protein